MEMPRTRAHIEAELNALRPYDCNNWNTAADGMRRLHVLLPELVVATECHDAIETILELIERLSDTPDLVQCELGTPGPMVHALEGLGGHEPQLIESVLRFPTPLTVWMVNRVMNALDKSDARWARFLHLLKQSAASPNAAPQAREDAMEFVRFQETR
jgi:hypothetical protein